MGGLQRDRLVRLVRLDRGEGPVHQQQRVVGGVDDHMDLREVDAGLYQHLFQHDRECRVVAQHFALELGELRDPLLGQQRIVGGVPIGRDPDEVRAVGLGGEGVGGASLTGYPGASAETKVAASPIGASTKSTFRQRSAK